MLEHQKQLIAWQKEINKQNSEMRRELKDLSTCVNRIASGGLVLLRDRIIQSCRLLLNVARLPSPPGTTSVICINATMMSLMATEMVNITTMR